jgi:hypothetical protein
MYYSRLSPAIQVLYIIILAVSRLLLLLMLQPVLLISYFSKIRRGFSFSTIYSPVYQNLLL